MRRSEPFALVQSSLESLTRERESTSSREWAREVYVRIEGRPFGSSLGRSVARLLTRRRTKNPPAGKLFIRRPRRAGEEKVRWRMLRRTRWSSTSSASNVISTLPTMPWPPSPLRNEAPPVRGLAAEACDTKCGKGRWDGSQSRDDDGAAPQRRALAARSRPAASTAPGKVWVTAQGENLEAGSADGLRPGSARRVESDRSVAASSRERTQRARGGGWSRMLVKLAGETLGLLLSRVEDVVEGAWL